MCSRTSPALSQPRHPSKKPSRAEDALALHVKGMLADGKPIPEPTGVIPTLASPDYRTDILALVTLQLPEPAA